MISLHEDKDFPCNLWSSYTGAISNGPITEDWYTSSGSLVYEPKVPNKVLSPEAVPPNLDKHCVYAWVEAR